MHSSLALCVFVATFGSIYGMGLPFFGDLPWVNNMPIIGNGKNQVEQFAVARDYCNRQFRPDPSLLDKLYGADPYLENENLKLYAICVCEQQKLINSVGEVIADPSGGILGAFFGPLMGPARNNFISNFNQCKYIQGATLTDLKYLRSLCLSRLFNGDRIF